MVCVCVCVETGRPGGSNSAFIREFLTLLAVCHTVIPECHDVDPSVIHYHAASPGPFAHTRLTIGTCFQVGSADCISAGIGTWYDSLARDGFFPFPLLCTSQVQVFSSFLWVVISRNVPPPPVSLQTEEGRRVRYFRMVGPAFRKGFADRLLMTSFLVVSFP